MIKKNKKILGLTLIEALVSTVVVGIGFIAVFQMTNFSVRSIDTSSERTKANYLVSMMAEDVISHRKQVYGIDPEKAAVDLEGKIMVDGAEVADAKYFADHLAGQEFLSVGCDGPALAADTDPDAPADGGVPKSIYSDKIDGPSNKEEKWNAVIANNRYLKCKSDKDIKKLKVYKICKWGSVCPGYQDASIFDDGLYIGRIQVNLNNGKKRKYLYFQAHSNVRK